MVYSEHSKAMVHIIAEEIVKFMTDIQTTPSIITGDAKNQVFLNMIQQNVNGAGQECTDCLELFLDTSIIDKPLNDENYRGLTSFYKNNICGGTCLSSTTNIHQESQVMVQTIAGNAGAFPPLSPDQMEMLVNNVHEAFQSSEISTLHYIPKNIVRKLLSESTWMDTLNNSMSPESQTNQNAASVNIVSTTGTGSQVTNISQTTLIHAVFETYFQSSESDIGNTLDDALATECYAIEQFVDDGFKSSIAAMWSTHYVEFITIISVGFLLFISSLVVYIRAHKK